MRGTHQKNIKQAQAKMMEAATQYATCAAFAHKELLVIACKQLEASINLALWPMRNECPYCRQPTVHAPSCTNEWTCKCFEDEPEVKETKWGEPISGNHDPLDYPEYYDYPDYYEDDLDHKE